jgi:hypothetical protein
MGGMNRGVYVLLTHMLGWARRLFRPVVDRFGTEKIGAGDPHRKS